MLPLTGVINYCFTVCICGFVTDFWVKPEPSISSSYNGGLIESHTWSIEPRHFQ